MIVVRQNALQNYFGLFFIKCLEFMVESFVQVVVLFDSGSPWSFKLNYGIPLPREFFFDAEVEDVVSHERIAER